MNHNNKLYTRVLTILAMFILPGLSHAVPTPPNCIAGPTDLIDGCVANAGDTFGSQTVANSGNDKPDTLIEAIIEFTTGDIVDLTLIDKSDRLVTDIILSDLNINDLEGTWELSSQELVSYISVKASNSFSLYKLTSPDYQGIWSTIGLINNGGNQAGLSHLSLWNGGISTTVSEPSTWLLMMIALLGFSLIKKDS